VSSCSGLFFRIAGFAFFSAFRARRSAIHFPCLERWTDVLCLAEDHAIYDPVLPVAFLCGEDSTPMWIVVCAVFFSLRGKSPGLIVWGRSIP
jgi:hypothetical protein